MPEPKKKKKRKSLKAETVSDEGVFPLDMDIPKLTKTRKKRPKQLSASTLLIRQSGSMLRSESDDERRPLSMLEGESSLESIGSSNSTDGSIAHDSRFQTTTRLSPPDSGLLSKSSSSFTSRRTSLPEGGASGRVWTFARTSTTIDLRSLRSTSGKLPTLVEAESTETVSSLSSASSHSSAVSDSSKSGLPARRHTVNVPDPSPMHPRHMSYPSQSAFNMARTQKMRLRKAHHEPPSSTELANRDALKESSRKGNRILGLLGIREKEKSLKLIDDVVTENGQKLTAAINQDDFVLVTALVAAGVAPLNECDASGTSPLNVALRDGKVNAALAVLNWDGAASLINLRDRYGVAPLHYAVRLPAVGISVVRKLLSFDNIDVNIADAKGNTPLHDFCEFHADRSVDVVGNLLFDRGADHRRTNAMGETAMHKVVSNINVYPAELLASSSHSSSNPLWLSPRSESEGDVTNDMFRTTVRSMIMSLLLNRGAAVDACNNAKETPLHYASRVGAAEVILPLLRAGANTRLRCKSGKTPLESVSDGSEPTSDAVREVFRMFEEREPSLAAFSPFADSTLDKIPPASWASVARYCGGAQVLMAVCRRLEVLMRALVRFVRIKESVDANTLVRLMAPSRVQQCWGRVETLHVECGAFVTDAVLAGIEHMTQLRELACLGAEQLSSVFLKRCTRMNALERIDLSYSPLIDDNAMVLVSRLPCLASISLGGNKFVTVDGLRALGKMESLRALNLRFSNVDDEGISVLSKSPHMVATLTDFSLEGCDYVTTRGLYRLTRLHALQVLSLASTCAVDANVEMLASLGRLSRLDCSYCHKLTVEAVYALVERCETLTVLKLNGCALLSESDVSEILMMAKLLNDVGAVNIEALFLRKNAIPFDTFFDEPSESEEETSSGSYVNRASSSSSSKTKGRRNSGRSLRRTAFQQ